MKKLLGVLVIGGLVIAGARYVYRRRGMIADTVSQLQEQILERVRELQLAAEDTEEDPDEETPGVAYADGGRRVFGA